MKTTQQTVKLKQVKIDPEFQALRPTNMVFVNRYRQAMRSGCVFPLIIVYVVGKFYTIISGIHRYMAMMQEYGEDYEIKVSIVENADKATRLEIFAKDNSDHGNPLDGIQRRSIANALLKAGVKEDHVANIFGISVGRLEKWEEYKVLVYDKKTKETEELPVKRGMEPPNNTMALKQWTEHRKVDRAGSFSEKCNELIRWFDGRLIIPTEENIAVLDGLIESANSYGEWAKIGKTV